MDGQDIKLFRGNTTYCTRVKIKNDVCVPAKSELLLEGEIKNEIGESFGLVEPFPIIKSRSAYRRVFGKSKKRQSMYKCYQYEQKRRDTE